MATKYTLPIYRDVPTLSSKSWQSDIRTWLFLALSRTLQERDIAKDSARLLDCEIPDQSTAR